MSSIRRSVATGGLVFVLIAALGAGAALAGRGGGGKASRGSSLALVVLSPEGGEPMHGGQVTFDVSTTATDKPSVRLSCSQDGTVVYNGSAGFYPEYPWQWAQVFTLESGAWTGGPAACTATMYHFDGRRYRDLVAISFAAAG